MENIKILISIYNKIKVIHSIVSKLQSINVVPNLVITPTPTINPIPTPIPVPVATPTINPTPTPVPVVTPTPIISIFKLTLKDSNTNLTIYENDNILTMMSYLSSYNINQPLTLQFNTNDTFTISSSLLFNFNNGSNYFTVKAKNGMTPVIDGNYTLGSVIVVGMSNFLLDGISCINGNFNDTSGCLIRNNSNTINTTYQNIKFKRGYCALRATGVIDGSGNVISFIDGMTIKDCVVEDVINGSFRIGNGDTFNLPASSNFSVRNLGYYDVRNLLIQNITLIDNFNKGVITGQLSGFMAMLLIKRTINLNINNIRCNNTSESLINIETSTNVLIDKIYVDNFGFKGTNNIQGLIVDSTDGCTVSNTFIKSNQDGIGKSVSYFNNVRNLFLYFNTFTHINNNDTPFYATDIALVKLVGNIFRSSGSSNPCEIAFKTSNGYVPSIAQDVLAENYNMFSSGGSYNTNLKFTNTGATSIIDVQVQINPTGNKINPTTYRSTYNLGINSIFNENNNLAFSSRINPNNTTSYVMYLDNISQGRNSVPTIQQSINSDAFGFTRTYPTDIGGTDRDAINLI